MNCLFSSDGMSDRDWMNDGQLESDLTVVFLKVRAGGLGSHQQYCWV